jgi:hypothetical protein
VYDAIQQAALTDSDFQGAFTYFGTQTQVEAQPAASGDTAIAYAGDIDDVTSVKRGDYTTEWTWTAASPVPANGMWIFAQKLLNHSGLFGMAAYKDDGVNDPSFETVEFPAFNPDDTDITFDASGRLAFKMKSITTSAGAKSVLNDTSADQIDYDGSSTVKQALDEKADASTTLAGYGITNAYTKTQTDSAITTALEGYAEETDLADIATSGDANDLIQESGDYLILDCGSSSTII